MKYITFLLIAALNFNTFAQSDTTKTKTALEQFSSRSGTITEKLYFDIGKVSSTTVQVILLTDLVSGDTTKGVVIETNIAAGYPSSSVYSRRAYLDVDEIDALIKAMAVLNQKATSIPSTYTEVNFTSRGGFEFGMYWSNNKWNPYIQTSELSNSTDYLKLTEFVTFRDFIIKCQLKLDSL